MDTPRHPGHRRLDRACPKEWKALKDFDEQTISDFTKENEKFAPYVEPLAPQRRHQALRPRSGRRGGVRNERQRDRHAGLRVPCDDWVASENASTRPVAVPGSLRTTYVRTPAGKAARVSWLLELNSGGEKKTIRSLQYMFRQGEAGYILTFSTVPSLAAKYEPTFKKSAESFRTG